jgi:hypothetical protein
MSAPDTGKLLWHGEGPHECRPKGEGCEVGAVWRCDCGQVWLCKSQYAWDRYWRRLYWFDRWLWPRSWAVAHSEHPDA